MLDKYHYFRNSPSESKQQQIVTNISNKLWDNCGHLTAYYLGGVLQLKHIAQGLGDEDFLNKKDILALMMDYKKSTDVPNEIKELADILLEEFDYKENNNAPNI